MIYPSTIDILRTVDANIEAKVEPSLSDLTGRSAMATIRHMLRHVMVRIEDEGQILTDDIAALRPLLQKVSAYFASLGEAQAGMAEAAEIDAVLKDSARDPAKYPSLAILGEEAGRLRECLYQALRRLQEIRDGRAGDAAYKSVRDAIRQYIAYQIEQEDKLIRPAFFGRGPRR
jgi:hypothetical protein